MGRHYRQITKKAYYWWSNFVWHPEGFQNVSLKSVFKYYSKAFLWMKTAYMKTAVKALHKAIDCGHL